MFEQLLALLKTLGDLQSIIKYIAAAFVGCATTATILYRVFRKREAADKDYIEQLEKLRKAADRRSEVRDQEAKELRDELDRASAARVLRFAKQEGAQGNDGIVFDRLTQYLAANSKPVAEVCARLSKTRLLRALATDHLGNLQEAHRLATVARSLEPENKDHQQLQEEVGLRLTGRALDGDVPENQHDIFEWLHLRDVDQVQATVLALRNESIRDLQAGRYLLSHLTAQAGHRLAQERLPTTDPIRRAAEFQFVQSLMPIGQTEQALSLARGLWKKYQAELGPAHHDTTSAGLLTATLLRELDRREEAISIAKDIWKIDKDRRTRGHPDMFRSGVIVTMILQELGRSAEAEPIARDILEKSKSVLPPGDDRITAASNTLVDILCDLGRTEEALTAAEALWESQKASLEPDHPHRLMSGSTVASILGKLGRNEKALPLAQEAWEALKAVLDPDHIGLSASALTVATILHALGQHADALPVAEYALERRTAFRGSRHRDTLEAAELVAAISERLGRPVKTRPEQEEVNPAL